MVLEVKVAHALTLHFPAQLLRQVQSGEYLFLESETPRSLQLNRYSLVD